VKYVELSGMLSNPRFRVQRYTNYLDWNVKIEDSITGLSVTCGRHKGFPRNELEAFEMLMEQIAVHDGASKST
jgi:hypothetical protein